MTSDTIQPLVNQLGKLDTQLFETDFLKTWTRSGADLEAVLLAAETIEKLYAENVSTRVFDTGLAVANFRDNSTRTRYSFASAANLLGLTVQELDESKSQIAHGETVRETANMISFLTQVIGIRDDIFLGQGHKYMVDVGQAVTEGFREGVLPQQPSIINLQCDLDHPTQSMADLLHLKQHFGSLEALRGKKIAMTWAYSPSYGKPLSVPQAIITLMTRFGARVSLAHPAGYNLVPETLDCAANFAAESGGAFEHVESMEEAFCDADVVYPKSWAPMHVMEQRTQLLQTGDSQGLKTLEQECLANNKKFVHWECDKQKMAATKNGSALYMHCLPADITGVSCEEGEVSADVFEHYRLQTYREAGHKPFIIAAMILLTKRNNAADLLGRLASANKPRHMTA